MDRNWHNDLDLRTAAPAVFLPPVMVDETGWDILLALRADKAFELSLTKLASLVSVPLERLTQWLVRLEGGKLVAGVKQAATGELHATLTRRGRELLDTYLSTANGLHAGTHH